GVVFRLTESTPKSAPGRCATRSRSNTSSPLWNWNSLIWLNAQFSGNGKPRFPEKPHDMPETNALDTNASELTREQTFRDPYTPGRYLLPRLLRAPWTPRK